MTILIPPDICGATAVFLMFLALWVFITNTNKYR